MISILIIMLYSFLLHTSNKLKIYIRNIRYPGDMLNMRSTEQFFKPIINWKIINAIQYLTTKHEDDGRFVDIFVSVKDKNDNYNSVYNLNNNLYKSVSEFSSNRDIINSIDDYRCNGLFYCFVISDKKIHNSFCGDKGFDLDTYFYTDAILETFNILSTKFNIKCINKKIIQSHNTHFEKTLLGCYFKEF